MGVRAWRAVAGLLVAMGSAGCGTADPPALGGSDGKDASAVMELCTPGREGCPCSQVGQMAPCGELVERTGTEVTCSMGYATCNGQTWGQCGGGTLMTKSVGGLALGGGGLHALSLGSSVVDGGTCAVCDPYCNGFVDTPSGLDAGSGLILGDGGEAGTIALAPIGTAGAGDAGTCTGLQCNIVTCPSNSPTRITGKVFDPNGSPAASPPGLPVYNAVVWVPNAVAGTALSAFTPGVACDTCDSLIKDKVLSSTLTAPDGSFTLPVPTGVAFDIVVQAGRWRRKITQAAIPTGSKCTATAITDGTLRFPRSHAEGDIPAIAIATGSGDALECQLLKMGIASSEFTAPGGSGRISMYYQNGAELSSGSQVASNLVTSAATLDQYNAVLWPCDNASPPRTSQVPSTSTMKNMVSYLTQGGRLYVSHWSAHDWLENDTTAPVAPATGTLASPITWQDYDSPNFDYNTDRGPANAACSNFTASGPCNTAGCSWSGGNCSGSPNAWNAADNDLITQVNQSFQKGTDFATWIFQSSVGANALPPTGDTGPMMAPPYIGASTPTMNYPLPTGYFSQLTWRHMAGAVNANGTAWLKGDTRTAYGNKQPTVTSGAGGLGPPGPVVQLLTYNTPVGAPVANQCGRVVFPVMHVSATSSGTFPGECGSPLPAMTPSDKILEFMLFDATGCLQADTVTPTPPATGFSGNSTFTRDFQATCPAATAPVWRGFSREDNMPLDSKIVFSVQTASTQAGLAAATSVPLVTDQGPLNQSSAYVSAGGDVSTVLKAAGQVSSTWLRVSMDLFPSSDGTQTPVLYGWAQNYDCAPSE